MLESFNQTPTLQYKCHNENKDRDLFIATAMPCTSVLRRIHRLNIHS
jgi:hypothetical protein